MQNQNAQLLAIKVDVDTERGTRVGVPNLLHVFQELKIPATFFFSFGPDHTGRAIKKIFRKGFFSKVKRTSVVSVYGIRTLLNGVLLPGPHIGRRHSKIMQNVRDAGFEVGIHCFDHIRWQDGVTKLPQEKIAKEFGKALAEFQRIFGESAQAAAAPGWQANAKTLAVYDEAHLAYASDMRGDKPFLPRIGDKIFNTLQIPTTLPTLDELLGQEDFPLERLILYYLSLLKNDKPNVITVHAELEGMKYLDWFKEFLMVAQKCTVDFVSLGEIAKSCMAQGQIPVMEVEQGTVAGRSGTLAMQKS